MKKTMISLILLCTYFTLTTIRVYGKVIDEENVSGLYNEAILVNRDMPALIDQTYLDKLHTVRDFGANFDIKPYKHPLKKGQHEKESLARASYAGTPGFMTCQQANSKNWKQVASKQQSNEILESSFLAGYRDFTQIQEDEINKHVDDINEKGKDWNNQRSELLSAIQFCKDKESQSCHEVKKKITDLVASSEYLTSKMHELLTLLGEYFNENERQLAQLQTCAGLAAMTHYVDYDQDDVGGGKSTKSFDGKILCYSDGVETQDYKACSRAVTAYNAAAIGQKGLEVVQGVIVQDNLMDKQMDLMSKTATSAADITKNTFEAQKASIEEQEKVSQQRVVFHGAKLAAMIAIHQTYPTTDEMIKSCSESGIRGNIGVKLRNTVRDSINQYITNIEKTVENDVNWKHNKEKMIAQDKKMEKTYADTTPRDICKYVIDSGEFSLLKNQNVKDTLKEIMLTAGIDMASEGLTASILNKQVDRLDDAIASIDGFTPEDLPGLQPEAVLRRYCEQYPNDPKCAGFTSPYQGTNWDGGGFGFDGGSGLATEIGAPGRADDQAGLASTGAAANAGEGAVFIADEPIDKGSGFIDTPPSPGNLKDLGGGGGAVGGSVEGGGGGLSPGGGNNNQAAPREFVSKVEIPQYAGGSADFSYLGGKGVDSKTKPTDDKNPLADFFKQKEGAKNNQDLNFGARSIASQDGSSLWKLISDRYSKAAEKKQLLDPETIENSMDTDF